MKKNENFINFFYILKMRKNDKHSITGSGLSGNCLEIATIL